VRTQSVVRGGQLGSQVAEWATYGPTELRFEIGLNGSDHVGNRSQAANGVVVHKVGQSYRIGDRVQVDDRFGELTSTTQPGSRAAMFRSCSSTPNRAPSLTDAHASWSHLAQPNRITVPGKHFIQEDSPDQIRNAVADFVRQLRPTSRD
jgi:hypothetical protein